MRYQLIFCVVYGFISGVAFNVVLDRQREYYQAQTIRLLLDVPIDTLTRVNVI